MIGIGLCVPALRGVGLSVPPPPPGPDFTLTEAADGQLLIADAQADLTIDIRSPAAHAGTYAVSWQDYAQEMVPLLPPAIAGDPVPGATLTAVPGLWLHQGQNPVTSWCWQARPVGGDFADLPGTTAPTLTVTDAMQGQEIRVVEVLANGTEAASAPLGIPAAPAGPTFNLTEDTDGQIVLVEASGALEVTITDPPIYAGTHSVPAADHMDGTALVVAPHVTGVATPGETLTAVPGLWLYSGTDPVLTRQWQSSDDGGASWEDLAGETGPILTVPAGLDGQRIRIVEALDGELGPSSIVTVAVPGGGGASLIDFAATAPHAGGGVTVTQVADGWRMVPAQDGGSPAATGILSWDLSAAGLVTGQGYTFALRLQRDIAESAGEGTRVRTANNKNLSSNIDNLGSDLLEAAADVTLSLNFVHDGADTRIGVRTGGWDIAQGITATAMSLTEQTT